MPISGRLVALDLASSSELSFTFIPSSLRAGIKAKGEWWGSAFDSCPPDYLQYWLNSFITPFSSSSNISRCHKSKSTSVDLCFEMMDSLICSPSPQYALFRSVRGFVKSFLISVACLLPKKWLLSIYFMFLFKEVGSYVFISTSWWLPYLPLLQILPDIWKNYFRLEEYPGFFKAMGFQACHKVLNWLWTNPKCYDRARRAPRTRLCCSGHHCGVWRVVTAGRWRAGWQRGRTLVTVVRVACTMSSLSAFLAGEGDSKERRLHGVILKGNC